MSIPNRVLGVRIRYYRNKIGYTQKELAEMVGLNESTIRNYELNNRTPDYETVQAIAKALEIDIYTLYCAETSPISSVAHILFDLECRYGLVPTEIDGEIVIKLNPDESPLYEPGYFAESETQGIRCMLCDWHQAYHSCLEEKVSPEDYETWQEKYPNFSYFSEDGTPIYGSDVNPHYDPNAKKDLQAEAEHVQRLMKEWGITEETLLSQIPDLED